jgi:hypothetical protein
MLVKEKASENNEKLFGKKKKLIIKKKINVYAK